MEKQDLDKLNEFNKIFEEKIEKLDNKLCIRINKLDNSINNKIDEKFAKIDKGFSKGFKEINRSTKDMYNRIDILFSSDLLSKRIINDHEDRIKRLESKVS